MGNNTYNVPNFNRENAAYHRGQRNKKKKTVSKQHHRYKRKFTKYFKDKNKLINNGRCFAINILLLIEHITESWSCLF